MTRDIGLQVAPPARTCSDVHCPFHGSLPVRGQLLDGTVVSARMQQTIVVARERLHTIKKYERLEKRTSRHQAHLPPCMDVKPGDAVKIAECRPLSKAKHFVVVQVTPSTGGASP